ncbi:hypothetical protein, partial [Caballeronia sp. INSB1]|uniref:hypothetical protein n=1 Tax=Caballeronia sp. INSB1 TaxID=2921751 RepID=UPI002032974C
IRRSRSSPPRSPQQANLKALNINPLLHFGLKPPFDEGVNPVPQKQNARQAGNAVQLRSFLR